MQRALNSLGRYAADLAQVWNAFWYTPADPSLLGLIRILAGTMLIYTHAIWGLVLNDFFGPKAWINRDLVELYQNEYAYSFWWWIPPGWIWPAYALAMLVLICFTIGLWTRLSAILSLVVVISFANRVPEALFGLDKINMILALYLAVGPSGRALSVDRLLAIHRGKDPTPRAASVGANFAIRLIQIHMCIIYFFAGISKFQGQVWWTGQAMWLAAFGNSEIQSIDMTWLAWHPWAVELLSHFTAIWELSFCALIWPRILRPLVLTGAVVLHVAIGATMGLWTFALVMLIGCASFLPPEGVGSALAMLKRRRERKGALAKESASR